MKFIPLFKTVMFNADLIIIENMEFFFYSVGANFVRPLWFINDFSYRKQIPNFGLPEFQTGEHSSPLQNEFNFR